MNKQKGFKTSLYFWGLVLVPVALGLHDFVFRLNFRLNPKAPEWHALSWLVAGGAALVFIAVIAWVDRYEREPWKWLLLALIWGAVVAPALGHQLRVLAAPVFTHDIKRAVHEVPITEEQGNLIIRAVIHSLAPLIEELSKGLFVFLVFLGVAHEFDDLVDGIVYGAMVGVGFAMAEQVPYLQEAAIKGDKEGFWQVVHYRIVLTGLWSHPMLTAFTGAGLGWARVTKSRWQRWTAPLFGFGLAVFIHSSWNFLSSVIGRISSFGQVVLVLIGPFAVLMVVLLLLAWQREHKVLEHLDLAGVSTEFASEGVMRSNRARLRAQWEAWRRGGFRLWQQVYRLQRTLIERAFLEWHMEEGHVIDVEGARAVLEEYNSTVEQLAQQLAEPEPAG